MINNLIVEVTLMLLVIHISNKGRLSFTPNVTWTFCIFPNTMVIADFLIMNIHAKFELYVPFFNCVNFFVYDETRI